MINYYSSSDDLCFIEYDYGEGDGDVYWQTIEIGKRIMLPTSNDASLDGYILTGWKMGDETISSPYVVPAPGPDEYGITLTAVWAPVVTATFEDTDGTVLKTIEAASGETIGLYDGREHPDSLIGWKADGSETVYGLGTSYRMDSDTVFTSVKADSDDVLVYVTDGGTLNGDTYTPLVEGAATLNATVEKEGYEFLGWLLTDSAGAEVAYADGMAVNGHGTVRAKAYLVRTGTDLCEIGYQYGEGSGTVTGQKAEAGQLVALPTSQDAQRAGYVLGGWKIGESTASGVYSVTESITATAEWEPANTVTFKDSDGTILEIQKAAPGDTVKLPDGKDVTKQGSILIGWMIEGSEAVYGLGTYYEMESNVVFVTVWAETADALVYVTDGGKLIGSTYTPIEGGAAILNATVEKEGYMFLGWLMTDSEGNTVAYANGMSVGASGAVRLTAYLVPEGTAVYEVKYDFGDGTGSITSQKAEAGQLIALPTSRDVHREGYALTGWEVSTATAGMMASLGAESVALGAETITGPYYMVTSESVTISAIWESTAPAPTPEPVWWDDDDEPVVIPSGKTSRSTSERTDLTVAIAAAAAVAASAIAALAIVDFSRREKRGSGLYFLQRDKAFAER